MRTGMQVKRMHRALTEITEALDAGLEEKAFELARRLKLEMLCDSPVDPVLYGWARFYELKSLYCLERHREAFELLEQNEPVEYAMTSRNVAWLYSVGSELAMRLGRVDDVIAYGRRCLEIRRAAKDTVAIAQCASTVCVLLDKLGRPEQNTEFALELLSAGQHTGAEQWLLRGARALLDNVARSGAPALRAKLVTLVNTLRSLHDDGASDSASELSRRITSSQWYLEVLGPARAAELMRERALADACRSGNVADASALLASGVSPDARDDSDRTPLIHAAFAGHTEVVRLLLERGAAVDAENVQRRTALVLAADQGHAEIVELLLARGADPDHAGIHDQTGLHVAGWQGHLGCVRALLANGADPERRDASENTPLMLTATEDQPEVVRSLVLGGACIDAPTSAGHTALMRAAMEGKLEVARVLLELGADPGLRDCQRMTAADWARQEGFLELASWLGWARHRIRPSA
jgi:ankyrin repeat protein